MRTYHQWFQNYSFTQPEYLPEFEGGWFSNWGSDTFYDEVSSSLQCRRPGWLAWNQGGKGGREMGGLSTRH